MQQTPADQKTKEVHSGNNQWLVNMLLSDDILMEVFCVFMFFTEFHC